MRDSLFEKPTRKIYRVSNTAIIKTPNCTRHPPRTLAPSSPTHDSHGNHSRRRRRRPARRSQGQERSPPGSRSHAIPDPCRSVSQFLALLGPQPNTPFPLSPQVEFYFSDSNLPRDGFLRRTVEESEDGCKNSAPCSS